jgi:hypothetical protein
MVDEIYAARLPTSAKASQLTDWIAERCTSCGDRRYATRLRFSSRINLGDVATGAVKPMIDCMWPIWGGSAKAPEDWRVDRLMLERECGDLPAGTVAVAVWALSPV